MRRGAKRPRIAVPAHFSTSVSAKLRGSEVSSYWNPVGPLAGPYRTHKNWVVRCDRKLYLATNLAPSVLWLLEPFTGGLAWRAPHRSTRHCHRKSETRGRWLWWVLVVVVLVVDWQTWSGRVGESDKWKHDIGKIWREDACRRLGGGETAQPWKARRTVLTLTKRFTRRRHVMSECILQRTNWTWRE
jgi:hypothetical protein